MPKSLESLLSECHESFLDSLPPLDPSRLLKDPNAVPDMIGVRFGGGIYVGKIAVNGIMHAVIARPNDDDAEPRPWISPGMDVPGANSDFDGLANTNAMLAAGSTLALWALSLRTGGFTDWHIPAKAVLALCYDAYMLTPTLPLSFLDAWYWSSTQSSVSSAWYQRFGFGSVGSTDKVDLAHAFAVRMMIIQE